MIAETADHVPHPRKRRGWLIAGLVGIALVILVVVQLVRGRKANVLPQLSGYLTAVGYHEGEDVAKGQFLAQIDPRQYQIDKQQAEAQLAKDQASLAQARSDLVRYTQLNQQKSIAEQTFVDQKFTVQQDEAAVEADRASIAQFDLDLLYCHITAPIAGRVGLRLVNPGNFVTQSTSPGIVTITTMKLTTVEFTVSLIGDLGGGWSASALGDAGKTTASH